MSRRTCILIGLAIGMYGCNHLYALTGYPASILPDYAQDVSISGADFSGIDIPAFRMVGIEQPCPEGSAWLFSIDDLRFFVGDNPHGNRWRLCLLKNKS